MDGHDYEYLVAKYLRGHGYTGVKVTKGSGDFGVDVTAHKAGHKYAIQCKYYSAPVSLGAIQEAVAGKALYDCDRAMVVTNSTFTKAAHELANANNVLLLENIHSAGAFRFSQLPKGVRIFLLGAYLFTASALFVAMLDINKEQPFWTAVYNVVTTITFMLFPLWIGPAIRGVKKLFRRATTRIKAGRVTPSADTEAAALAHPERPGINSVALQPFLPIEVSDNRDEFANNLSKLSVLTTSTIQRKCKCENKCAYAVLQCLQAYGMVREIRQFTYKWTEKALLLGAEGRNG